jgi:dimethylglycine dehydrogenase
VDRSRQDRRVAPLLLEKRYLTSRELTHDVNPDEAGLQRFVKLDKGGFVGRDALRTRRALAASGDEPYRWRLAYLAVAADHADVHAADGVYADGRPVGLVTSGAYGFHCRQSLAFAYLAPEHAEPGTELEVRVVGEPCGARVLSEAVHDPTNARLRTQKGGHRP